MQDQEKLNGDVDLRYFADKLLRQQGVTSIVYQAEHQSLL